MPAPNAISVKISSPIQAPARKTGEAKDADFDGFLAASIEKASSSGTDVAAEDSDSLQKEQPSTNTNDILLLSLMQNEPFIRPSAASKLTIGSAAKSSQNNDPIQGAASAQETPGIAVVLAGYSPRQSGNAALDSLQEVDKSATMEAPTQHPELQLRTSRETQQLAVGNAEIAAALTIESKAKFSNHRLIAIEAASGDTKSHNANTIAELAASIADGSGKSISPADAAASTSLPPSGLGIPNLSIDLNQAQNLGDKHVTIVEAPVGSRAWVDEASEKIHLLVKENHQHAEIRVNPAELGPIEIQIAMVQGEASISFSADHADTRNALETALPRLKELLADSGISLSGAFVGTDRRPPSQPAPIPMEDSNSKSARIAEPTIDSLSVFSRRAAIKSAVDLFA